MDKLVAVWTRQYIRPRDLKPDRICMTDERLNKIVNDAYNAGHSDGEQQGRVNLRKDIESGEVSEIRKIDAPS